MTRILLVDDEPLLCEELADCLELEDYDVDMRHNVPDALAAIQETAFDVVITDLKMPEIGGLDFIRKLKEQAFEGIIIVVSGHGAESSRTDAMDLGATACLPKPLDVEVVIDLLADAA